MRAPGCAALAKQAPVNAVIIKVVLIGFALVSAALAYSAPAQAFLLPSGASVGAGSEWIFDSNLGPAQVRMVSREEDGPGVAHYTWAMQVGGLHYRETLRLLPDRLGVEARSFAAFGLLEQRYEFETPELVLELPFHVGDTWEWSGKVAYGDRSVPAEAVGEVIAREVVTVPAGDFQVFHIRFQRRDDFGTRQEIDLWFDPDVGPIRAVGDLRWQGLIGYVQDLVGFTRFEVELVRYQLQRQELTATDSNVNPEERGASKQ